MNITISDPTLRDGNHALKHSLTLEQIKAYAERADDAGVDIIEVGHGNGLGATSLQLGFSAFSDIDMLSCARRHIKKAKLGIHIIPGFGKYSDLDKAIDVGVDIFRVASHCTEADTTERYINYLNKKNKIVYGVLMMSHMASNEQLILESNKFIHYGAGAIILMDSAGYFTPKDIHEKISSLAAHLPVPVGFHGHNNLGLAIANSLSAVEAGATLIDATIKGLGAGAGNTALEVFIAAIQRYQYKSNVDFGKIIKLADFSEEFLFKIIPAIKSSNIFSGLHGVFSGFNEKVKGLSHKYNLDPELIYRELGMRKVVAGQEDIIIDVCEKLAAERNSQRSFL